MRVPEELEVFKLADDLAHAIYDLTSVFPSEERYGLTTQLRRAAISIPSNLAEGCSRESRADFRRFVEIALGSSMEVKYQLSFARRRNWLCGVAYAEAEVHRSVYSEVETLNLRVGKMLASLGKTLRADHPKPQAPETP